VSLDQFPAAYAKVICDQNFKCASTEDIAGRTKQDCLNTNSSTITFILPELRASQAKGRFVYDGAKMGTCIAGLGALSCADWVTGLADPPGCTDAFVPKVAVGGACQQDAECIGGTCAGADTTVMPPVDGACKARIAHGAACAIEDTCVDGDYCDGTCTSHKAGGAACTSSDQCGYACNDTTMKCSGYAGCAVAPVTAGGTVVALVGLGLLLFTARRRRR
jgi:MYXO-CTERM domain-containing protein